MHRTLKASASTLLLLFKPRFLLHRSCPNMGLSSLRAPALSKRPCDQPPGSTGRRDSPRCPEKQKLSRTKPRAAMFLKLSSYEG